MNARKLAGVIVGIALLCALLIGGLLYMETLYPDYATALAVKPGMTRSEVVELLGVFYDGPTTPGQYADVDSIIAQMKNSKSITYICFWHIAHSRDMVWIGFDDNDIVIETYIKTKNP
jgi:hypothetical protein